MAAEVATTQWVKGFLPFTIIGVALITAVGFGVYIKRSAASSSVVVSPGSSTVAEPRPPASPVNGSDPPHVKGAKAASVTLEEFADFQCPACAHLYPLLKSIEAEYGDRVRVVFRPFPLPQHKYAVRASRAAEAAGLQGKFWEMHDLLYENRASWNEAADVRPIFEDYARRLGLDIEKFNRDQYNKEVSARLTQDFQRGRSLGLKGTPTVYLNGKEMPYSQLRTLDDLRTALNNALIDSKR